MIKFAGWLGVLWQLTPAAYLSVTGTAPSWVRWTTASWVAIYALYAIAKTVSND